MSSFCDRQLFVVQGPTLEERRERQEIDRLRDLPRQKGLTTLLPGPPIQFVDGPSLAGQFLEIWKNESYRFNTRRQEPLILDCGANVGMGTLYWKHLYPQARVIAFEPDPTIFRVLRENLAARNLTKVQPINAAVWTKEGEVSFWEEGTDLGKLLPHPESQATPQNSSNRSAAGLSRWPRRFSEAGHRERRGTCAPGLQRLPAPSEPSFRRVSFRDRTTAAIGCPHLDHPSRWFSVLRSTATSDSKPIPHSPEAPWTGPDD